MPEAYVNGHHIKTSIIGARQTEFYDKPFFKENYVDVFLKSGDIIEWHIEDVKVELKFKGNNIPNPISWLDMLTHLRPKTPSTHTLKKHPEVARLRELIQSKEAQRKYRGCWILMDSDMRADDNAEHLYRYLMKKNATKNAYFVLNRESDDWARLEAEGIQLLEMRSDDQIAAQFNASLLISSHADHYISWPIERSLIEDLAKWKMVFLQHGVIKDDLSDWLNTKGFDVFVTSGKAEHESIASPGSRYPYTPKEVLLTGLARHDMLLEVARKTTPDTILIMPTWRRYLTDETDRNGNARKKTDQFFESEFAKQWSAILASEELRDAAKKSG
jgi:hypothetical protein